MEPGAISLRGDGARGRRLQRLDYVLLQLWMLHVRRAGIGELARDADRFTLLEQFHPIVSRVRRVLLWLAERGRRGIGEIDGRILGADMLDRRVLPYPRQEIFAM